MLLLHPGKIALIVGLLVVGLIWVVIIRDGTTDPAPPTVLKPVTEAQVVERKPSATPDASQPVGRSERLPTATVTLRALKTAAPGVPTLTPTPIPVYHVVEQGEIPWLIAEKYGLAVDTLLELNEISDPTRLQIGQQLLIPVTVTPTPAWPTPTPTSAVSPTPTPEPVYHITQAGDTLSVIAGKYDTNVANLMIANDLADPQKLQVGQRLLIPPDGVSFDTPTMVHAIETGDTFGRLAFLYGSTIGDILAANPGLEPTTLRIGQQVIVPITAPPANPRANPRLAQITSPEAPSANLSVLQQQIVDETNTQRRTHGLPSLQADDELARIALAHAQDMVKRGYFAHITPEGVDLHGRFEQQGVQATWIGENIQFNTQPEDRTVSAAVEWLMNSAPHRANMLHERFNSIGAGVAEEPPGWYTFVLVFAQR